MKFSIVTPAYNMESWIAETIEGVVYQEGNFEIEYTIVDDGSTDKTIAIIEDYEKRLNDGTISIKCRGVLMRHIKQGNSGMYQAINEGFEVATGDVYAWINADDLYEPGAFEAIRKTFEAFPDIEWLKGITATIGERNRRLLPGACRIYHRDWLKQGVYGMESYFVEQDSVFWRSSLWRKGGPIPPHYRSAGDYWLWLSFAKYAALWSLDMPISMFRKREGQISKNIEKYKREQWQARGQRPLAAWLPRLFFYPYFFLPEALRAPFEKLYPFLFPRQPREYLTIEENEVRKKIMSSFLVRHAHAH